jgi:hypothetical protein
MTRVPADNLIKIRGGPSDPESIQIEDITGLDNLEVSMPQVRSPGDVSAQPKIARKSGREKCTKPLT